MEEAFKSLPFEIMKEKVLKDEMYNLGLSHFVDPHFPPRECSIYCFTELYPFDHIIHWRRPHEFFGGSSIIPRENWCKWISPRYYEVTIG